MWFVIGNTQHKQHCGHSLISTPAQQQKETRRTRKVKHPNTTTWTSRGRRFSTAGGRQRAEPWNQRFFIKQQEWTDGGTDGRTHSTFSVDVQLFAPNDGGVVKAVGHFAVERPCTAPSHRQQQHGSFRKLVHHVVAVLVVQQHFVEEPLVPGVGAFGCLTVEPQADHNVVLSNVVVVAHRHRSTNWDWRTVHSNIQTNNFIYYKWTEVLVSKKEGYAELQKQNRAMYRLASRDRQKCLQLDFKSGCLKIRKGALNADLKKLVNLFIFIHATSPVQNNHMGPNVHFFLIWSNFEKKCSVAYILQTTLSFTWLKTWGSREAYWISSLQVCKHMLTFAAVCVCTHQFLLESSHCTQSGFRCLPGKQTSPCAGSRPAGP